MVINDIIGISNNFKKDLLSFLSKIDETEVLNILFVYKMQLRFLKQYPANKKTLAIIDNIEFTIKIIKSHCDKQNYVILDKL